MVGWAWFAGVGILVLVATDGFLYAVIDYQYDSQQDRTPLPKAILAGVSLLLALATGRRTLRNARTVLSDRASAIAAVALTVSTILVMLVWVLVAIASGPL